MRSILSNTSLDFFTACLPESFLNIIARLVDFWPDNVYQAVKKDKDCLLFIVNEKDIIEKHTYNGILMEPYGSQHPGKGSTNKTLTICMGDSYQQKSIGTSKDLLECFLYSIDSALSGTIDT